MPGDLDYRYQPSLDQHTRDLHIVVRDMRRPRGEQVVHTLTRAGLYDAAATLCDLVAARSQQWADTHDGNHLPDGETPQRRAAAAQLRQRTATEPPAAAEPAATAACDEREPRPVTVAGRDCSRALVTERYVTVDLDRERYDGVTAYLGLP